MEQGSTISQRIVSVVLTGGPCGGKSTARSWILAAMEARGWYVMFVPEAATELINAGIDRVSCGGRAPFQSRVMDLQLRKEAQAWDKARACGKPRVLVVFDRGLPDGQAYADHDDFTAILAAHGLDRAAARARYDMVFHLVSAAKGAEDHYEVANNSARSETLREAAAADDATIDAWRGHPRLCIIDNSTGFNDKMQRLIDALCQALDAL